MIVGFSCTLWERFFLQASLKMVRFCEFILCWVRSSFWLLLAVIYGWFGSKEPPTSLDDLFFSLVPLRIVLFHQHLASRKLTAKPLPRCYPYSHSPELSFTIWSVRCAFQAIVNSLIFFTLTAKFSIKLWDFLCSGIFVLLSSRHAPFTVLPPMANGALRYRFSMSPLQWNELVK